MSDPLEHDEVLEGYSEWVNNALFAAATDEDHVIWLGEGRWLILGIEGPDVFLVEIRRAKVEPSA